MSIKSRRLQLHKILMEALGSDCVYFQPPASITMKYPCIVYNHTNISTLYSNNYIYKSYDEYEVTIISKDPLPEEIMEKIGSIRYSFFSRHYVSDNLHHYLYHIDVYERI